MLPLPDCDFSSSDVFRNFALMVEGKPMWINKEFLALHSPVFNQMFFSDNFKEKDAKEVPLPEKKWADVELLMRHVFLADTTTLNLESVLTLLPLADEYDLALLRDKCVAFIQGLIQTTPVVSPLIVELIRHCHQHHLYHHIEQTLLQKINKDNICEMAEVAWSNQWESLEEKCKNRLGEFLHSSRLRDSELLHMIKLCSRHGLKRQLQIGLSRVTWENIKYLLSKASSEDPGLRQSLQQRLLDIIYKDTRRIDFPTGRIFDLIILLYHQGLKLDMSWGSFALFLMGLDELSPRQMQALKATNDWELVETVMEHQFFNSARSCQDSILHPRHFSIFRPTW